MVRITIDTNQDDTSTIQSVITILNQELARKKGKEAPSGPAQETPQEQTRAGGAFQHQNTSNLMSMFSEDMPSTDPQTYQKHAESSEPSSKQQSSESDDFLFGSVEDVASKDPGQADKQERPTRRDTRTSEEHDDDADVDVTEY